MKRGTQDGVDRVLQLSQHLLVRGNEQADGDVVQSFGLFEQLQFLVEENGCTIGQAALRFVLRSPATVSALPNIYEREQVIEFAGAADVPDITDEQAARIERLYETNFGIEPGIIEAAVEADSATREKAVSS